MKHVLTFENCIIIEKREFFNSVEEVQAKILRLKLPKELKDAAIDLVGSKYVTAGKGRIIGLLLHPDLKKKIKEKNLPSGFSMGIDKDGFYIHTHRVT